MESPSLSLVNQPSLNVPFSSSQPFLAYKLAEAIGDDFPIFSNRPLSPSQATSGAVGWGGRRWYPHGEARDARGLRGVKGWRCGRPRNRGGWRTKKLMVNMQKWSDIRGFTVKNAGFSITNGGLTDFKRPKMSLNQQKMLDHRSRKGWTIGSKTGSYALVCLTRKTPIFHGPSDQFELVDPDRHSNTTSKTGQLTVACSKSLTIHFGPGEYQKKRSPFCVYSAPMFGKHWESLKNCWGKAFCE